MSVVDSAPYGRRVGAGQGDGAVWCVLALLAGCLCQRAEHPSCVSGAWSCRSYGALVARSRRAVRFAHSPRGQGLRAPTPGLPHPRQAELAGFCALRARAALRAGVSVLAHVATLMFVLAHAATRLRARWWRAPAALFASHQPPRAGAARPYPRTPARGMLSLQAFARCRAQPPSRVRAGAASLRDLRCCYEHNFVGSINVIHADLFPDF